MFYFLVADCLQRDSDRNRGRNMKVLYMSKTFQNNNYIIEMDRRKMDVRKEQDSRLK